MISNTQIEFKRLETEIQSCQICTDDLPLGANPIVQINLKAKILIAGQAPGRIVHQTNIPFNDKSGDRLRDWMGIDKTLFYDSTKIAIVPMGFCFPGTGKSGDLPPRKECAKQWRQPLLDQLPNIELTLLIGMYAMKWHMGDQMKKNLTTTVQHFISTNKFGNSDQTNNTESNSDSDRYVPSKIIPLPHPSPRNYGWFKKNPWFESEVLPLLRKDIKKLMI